MKTGKIIKIISNTYTIIVDNKKIECQARGKFRHQKITPLVGDFCEVDIENKYIMQILPRKNYLLRPSIANVDVALIIMSLKEPDFSEYLLDKLITMISLNQILPMICFTKLDLLDNEQIKKFTQIKKYYQNLEYQVFTNQEISQIKNQLKGKIVVVTGQTGAGKSTLLNKLDPSLQLKTSPISKALNRGVHTTRHTEIYEFAGFYIADTPGFSALELSGYQNEEIRKSFIEFDKFPCRFKDCSHTKEQICGVKQAVEIGEILKSRYESYISFLSEVSK